MRKFKSKVLYSFSGSGQGHMAKALALKPELDRRYDVDYLISCQNMPSLFSVNQTLHGATLFFRNGEMNIWETWTKNNWKNLVKEISDLDIKKYDFVISDYEIVSALSAVANDYENIVSLSHQASFYHKETPRPKSTNLFNKIVSESVMRNFAPVPIRNSLSVHYDLYNDYFMYPLLRQQILDMDENTEDDGEYLVYLSKNSLEDMVKTFHSFPKEKFNIFHPKKTSNIEYYDNVTVYKTDQNHFMNKLKTCTGIIANSGFELPSEAMYLGKRLLAIPQYKQYEQECNAAALEILGVDTGRKFSKSTVEKFLKSGTRIERKYITSPSEALDRVEAKIR